MRPWTGEAASLAERIATFIDTSLDEAAAEPFEQLALDIHRWQARHDPVVEALLEGRAAASWLEIPAVPVGLFKDLPVGTVDPHTEAPVVFRTSGTTGGDRGAHRMRSTALYDRGALAWARRCVPEAPTRVVALLEDPDTAPDSSLSHMVGLFGGASWHVRGGELDAAGASEAVRRAPGAVYVAATAFALAEWLDGSPPALPTGSVVMVTGGFKGRVHRLEGEALYEATRQRLAPTRLVTEYGMTELSSQLWGAPDGPYRPPPWLRVVAVEPASGAPLPAGEAGQLRFYDLCNLDGTVGIETLDEGTVAPDGAVTLRGRLRGAPERGCSLTVEEAWERRR